MNIETKRKKWEPSAPYKDTGPAKNLLQPRLKTGGISLGGGAFSLGGGGITLAAKKDDLAGSREGEKLEQFAERVLNDAQKRFKEGAKKEQAKYLDAIDSEYWFCVCFQTRSQKDEFLQKSGLWDYGDKYLDGQEVARILDIKLSPVDFKYNDNVRINKELASLSVGVPRRLKSKRR